MSHCHSSKISGWQQTENVTKKVNLHCFRLHRSYLISLIVKSWRKFLELNPKGPYIRKRKRKLLSCVHLLHEVGVWKLGSFMSQSGSKAKKCANAHFKFVVLLIYMYCFNFCLSRCHHHRHCLSSLLLWSTDFATTVTWLLHFSSLLRVLRFFFWAACVTEWKIIFVIYSPGLKFTIKLLYYHLGQISMYRIIDTCIMNVKRFWVPLLQLLVNSFCLFI